MRRATTSSNSNSSESRLTKSTAKESDPLLQRNDKKNRQMESDEETPGYNTLEEERSSFSYRAVSPYPSVDESEAQLILEIPEEIYAVRKAALQVLKPLTKTWVIISLGFSLTVLFGMARWTNLLPSIPFWFILMPAWATHVGLLWLHILSARALSQFIAEANDSRHQPDSRDHLNRTEYLPLLQKSLKYGLKTGVLSFFIFLFEILIFCKLAREHMSLAMAFWPIWLLVIGALVDGIICKTQHIMRVACWVLILVAMVLLVLKVDWGWNIRWRSVVSPVVCVLLVASGTLIYIVYGHQVGYYRLTEAQLTAGNLYSLAALICIVLVVMIGEVIPLARPVEVETRLFVVILAPLVVTLVGMGAWVVSRDEFGRLLLYGGQSAVHPRKLRWESDLGWTCVKGRGVAVIPMFGEVSFEPLKASRADNWTMRFYPVEEEILRTEELERSHPYLQVSPTRSMV